MDRNAITLNVENLCAGFLTARGEIRAVDGVSFTVPAHGIVGIVGESGCGKSMTARSIIRLIKYPGRITGGRVTLCGKELTSLSEHDMANVRGEEISMIFQEPMTSLNPVMKVGVQVQEVVALHRRVSRREAKAEVLRMFERAGISEAERRYSCYPHELSGGLRQRVMIAMAMICRPKLLIADEPTTALDVTVEAQILDLMRQLREEIGTSIILISHNLGVVAEICDQVHVMYAGRIVESADVFELFRRPAHPYTLGLMNAVGSLERRQPRLAAIEGTVPSLLELGEGCSFAPRCPMRREGCMKAAPGLAELAKGHLVRCPVAAGEV